MKKISTKIVVLSVINTTIIAIINVAMSIYMNFSQSAGGQGAIAVATESTTTSADAATAVVQRTGLAAIMPPTPILLGLLASLILGILMAYLLGKYISKPIRLVNQRYVR